MWVFRERNCRRKKTDPHTRRWKTARALSKAEAHQEQAPKSIWRSVLTFRWTGREAVVGAACWGMPGVGTPLTSHGLEAGLLQPRTPSLAEPREVVSSPLASGPCQSGAQWPAGSGPLPATSQARPRPQHAGSHSPGATPTLFRSRPPGSQPPSAARWKHRPDVGTVARRGGGGGSGWGVSTWRVSRAWRGLGTSERKGPRHPH